jgi:DNA-directed RNA polymerase specialized sigma24 family protein
MANELEELLERARSGCEQAKTELVRLYGPALRRVVRRALKQKSIGYSGGSDLVQLVWLDFFRFTLSQQTYTNPDHLFAFLSGMARNKIREALRQHYGTQKYDRSRQESLEAATGAGGVLVDPRPTPAQAAEAGDE